MNLLEIWGTIVVGLVTILIAGWLVLALLSFFDWLKRVINTPYDIWDVLNVLLNAVIGILIILIAYKVGAIVLYKLDRL